MARLCRGFYLVKEYGEHYHTERPHQGLGNRRSSRSRRKARRKLLRDARGYAGRCRTTIMLRHNKRAAGDVPPSG
jgi:hypothetical protein